MLSSVLSRRVLGALLCVSAAACGPRGTSDLVPTPDPAPATSTASAADSRAELRDELAARRAIAIARLHAYAQAGVFPRNTTVAPSGHFFRDADSRLCAVANLVHQDGRDDLVDAVVRENNGLVIADVHDGPLHDWILSSGLTQEELARIQRPAPMIRPTPKPQPMPSAVLPHATTAPAVAAQLPTESEMRTQLQAQLAAVEARLLADTDASLDVAVSRLVAAGS